MSLLVSHCGRQLVLCHRSPMAAEWSFHTTELCLRPPDLVYQIFLSLLSKSISFKQVEKVFLCTLLQTHCRLWQTHCRLWQTHCRQTHCRLWQSQYRLHTCSWDILMCLQRLAVFQLFTETSFLPSSSSLSSLLSLFLPPLSAPSSHPSSFFLSLLLPAVSGRTMVFRLCFPLRATCYKQHLTPFWVQTQRLSDWAHNQHHLSSAHKAHNGNF